MNAVYHMLGLTKQAFHQHLDRYFLMMEEQQNIIPLIQQIRQDHPRLSARAMYHLIRPTCMGRDRFEAFCFENGFKLEVKRSFLRTTNSLGVTRFPNLIMEIEVAYVNQVWVSDITYYRIADRFYYLTFIMDLFSRRIVGYSLSRDLLTGNTTIVALKMALDSRKPAPGLIFHSDGGGQYYCKDFLIITKKHEIKNSMCESVYENPHAERINGTIKNDYVVQYGPKDYLQLCSMLRKAVDMYNYIKPHKALNRLSPVDFECSMANTRCNSYETKEKQSRTNNNFENRYKNLLKTVNTIQA